MKYYEGSAVDIIYNVEKWPDLSISMANSMIIDVGNGLAHLHKIGIVHFDIKPGNILYAKHTGLEFPVFVLSDFGASNK